VQGDGPTRPGPSAVREAEVTGGQLLDLGSGGAVQETHCDGFGAVVVRDVYGLGVEREVGLRCVSCAVGLMESLVCWHRQVMVTASPG
jgi:hypothetical protein